MQRRHGESHAFSLGISERNKHKTHLRKIWQIERIYVIITLEITCRKRGYSVCISQS